MTDSQGNLRNEDFRKLLTTARSSRPAESTIAKPTPPPTSAPATFRHKNKKYLANKYKKGPSTNSELASILKPKREKTEEELEEERLQSILKNYRDRAAERRKQGDQQDEATRLATTGYRAVPGDPISAKNQADLKQQQILESKYLGGDIEHTHLVKGLDYSLLNKVRNEGKRHDDDEEEDDDIEEAFTEGGKKATTDLKNELVQSNSENRMVRSMHRVLFKNELPLKNDLFAKGRMAYVVELEDDDSEIPTTLLRSLHDCPRPESIQSIKANNLIIAKLTQVLSYLRTDHKKNKKKEEVASTRREEKPAKAKGESIYDDLDDYVPRRRRSRSRERTKRDYFEKPKEHRSTKPSSSSSSSSHHRRERDEKEKQKQLEEKLEKRRKETESAGYDECYPGGMAELGSGWDSDDDDFSKMDMGLKKGVVNRWDFDTEEDYANYQEGREALPKAAYQYGLKTGDGRKTRKHQAMSEAKKIDRELSQINKIMEKRKSAADGGDTDYKKPKY